MHTEKKKGTSRNGVEDFPISPEQMKWPFRTPEERKKIVAWVKKQGKRDRVKSLEDMEPAPF